MRNLALNDNLNFKIRKTLPIYFAVNGVEKKIFANLEILLAGNMYVNLYQKLSFPFVQLRTSKSHPAYNLYFL
jgi:hypothetical protein